MTNHRIIHLENAFTFHNQNMILHNINVEVYKGEFTYLIGKTGSGKSSLLKTLYAELPLQEGIGEIAGYNLKLISEKEIPYLRRKLGIIFQDFNLLQDRTVDENLAFVLRATNWTDKNLINNRISEVLKMVGIQTKGFKYPHELSGGEQQRLVIARALLNNPEVILADEPTGNLDPEVTDDIMILLKKISDNGTAILCATHDYRIINKYPGKIYRCEEGRIEQVKFVG